MVNVAVFASGSGTNFENLVHADLHYARIQLLIVDQKQAYVIERAKKNHIPYYYVNPKAYSSKKEYEQQILTYLKEYEIEIVALAGYMRYIGEVLLKHYGGKIINIHPAYLPCFPGAHGIKDAYEAKAKETGVTIHYVDEGVDTGKIIYQEKFEINPLWTLEELEERVHALEYQLYPKVLDQLCKEEIKNDETSID